MKNQTLIGLLQLSIGLQTIWAQSSVFTYQGRLFDNNQAAVGTYDFQFRLADAATNGNYVGATLNQAPVSVTNGVFTVSLDFGSGIFDGSARFLEAGVRTNGSSGNYSILQPLQPITMAPYAMLANSAVAAGVASNLVAGAVLTNLTIVGSTIQAGTITAAQLDPATDAAYRALDTNAVKAIIAQVATSDPARSSRWVDAKLVFGAKGDGVTDDTAALQTALNSLASVPASNTTLFLPPGTYKLSGTLRLPPSSFPNNPVSGVNTGWRLSGAGMTATRLVWPSLHNGIGLALTNALGYEAVIIEDLSLVGPLMTAWDSTDTSIGLALGPFSPHPAASWSGDDNLVRNCAFLGWGYGMTSTNQWVLTIDNCIVASNNFEALRFVGTHAVTVQNSRIRGGWITACGIGIGFHPPLNFGYGDNAQILNCLICNCTNGIFNQELNLISLNNHLESCGSYYTLISPPSGASPPATTIIGGYTLDDNQPWTNGFAGQLLMDAPSARLTMVQNCWLNGGPSPWRPFFNVTNIDSSNFQLPTYWGRAYFPGLWNTTSNVVVYPLGTAPPSGGTGLVRAGTPGFDSGASTPQPSPIGISKLHMQLMKSQGSL